MVKWIYEDSRKFKHLVGIEMFLHPFKSSFLEVLSFRRSFSESTCMQSAEVVSRKVCNSFCRYGRSIRGRVAREHFLSIVSLFLLLNILALPLLTMATVPSKLIAARVHVLGLLYLLNLHAQVFQLPTGHMILSECPMNAPYTTCRE